jgi:hypothetical protein
MRELVWRRSMIRAAGLTISAALVLFLCVGAVGNQAWAHAYHSHLGHVTAPKAAVSLQHKSEAQALRDWVAGFLRKVATLTDNQIADDDSAKGRSTSSVEEHNRTDPRDDASNLCAGFEACSGALTPGVPMLKVWGARHTIWNPVPRLAYAPFAPPGARKPPRSFA